MSTRRIAESLNRHRGKAKRLCQHASLPTGIDNNWAENRTQPIALERLSCPFSSGVLRA